MTLEIVSMGLLSMLFNNLSRCESKKNISNHFKLVNPDVLVSWMHSITYVRNICTHHGRLWNRTLTLKPALPKSTLGVWLSNKNINPDKIYAFLCCMLYLLKIINPKTQFSNRLHDLLAKYPDVNTHSMGFAKNWELEELWKKVD